MQHIVVKHESVNCDIKPDWYLYKVDENGTVVGKEDELLNKVQCKLCDRGFQDENEHKKWITPTGAESLNEFKCYQCRERTFVSKRDLKQHLNFCTAKSIR